MTIKQLEDAGLIVEIIEDPALSFRRTDTFGLDSVGIRHPSIISRVSQVTYARLIGVGMVRTAACEGCT